MVTVGVYKGEGVDPLSYDGCCSYFGKFKNRVMVYSVSNREISEGFLHERCDIFMLAGGRDRFYARDLAGRANAMIQRFVRTGGLYIGICAGAYYAGKRVVFDQGGPLEVIEERELGFYPDEVCGPYYTPYFYDERQGARIADIKGYDSKEITCYYNGGPSFLRASLLPNVTCVARYNNKGMRSDWAVVAVKVEKGFAFLSGVHFEMRCEGEPPEDRFKRDLFFIGVLNRYLAERKQSA